MRSSPVVTDHTLSATSSPTLPKIEPLVTEKTKAILAVHQLGMPARMNEICDVASARDLTVIEDGACAIGSSYDGRKIGKPFGRAVGFSFHPRKVITTGEGGMITTDDDSLARRLRLLRQHGMDVCDLARHTSRDVMVESYVCVGYNYRMTDIQAAIGIEQLKKLEWIVQQRRKIAQRYDAELSHLPGVKVPLVPDNIVFNYQSYAVRITDKARATRDQIMQALLSKGIATRRGVMTIHRQPAYAASCSKLKLPVTECASDHSILLPLFPEMTRVQQDRVVGAMTDLLT